MNHDDEIPEPVRRQFEMEIARYYHDGVDTSSWEDAKAAYERAWEAVFSREAA